MFVHAAAALNKKAVVYYGGWIHPRITGYNFHENLYFTHSKSPCGARGYLCDHCEKARKSIKVDFFEDKIRTAVLKNKFRNLLKNIGYKGLVVLNYLKKGLNVVGSKLNV